MNEQTISFADPPFGCPLDVILDIPVPLSVNHTRRENKAARGDVEKWLTTADATLMASGQFRTARKQRKPDQPCEIRIILCPVKCKLDPDNPIKNAVDYLRRIEMLKNDTGKFVRRLVVEWGKAPEGCRIVISESA